MAKKMYDILPPKAVKKKEAPLAKEPSRKLRKPVSKVRVPKAAPVMESVAQPQKQEHKFPWILISSILLFLIVIVAGVYLYITLPEATIEIWPKIDSITIQDNVIVKTQTT